MNQTQKLNQGQALQQTLAPLQVQYVRMLEMNAAAIEDEVRRRLDENPALAADRDTADDSAYAGGDASADSYDSDSGYDSEDDRADYAYRRRLSSQRSGGRMPIEANAAAGPDLAESLNGQLAELPLDKRARALARYVIGSLDSNGRLTRTPQAMADDVSIATGADVTAADMRAAMAVVRSLDPAGVGAVDLRDCLLLQLDRKTPSQAVDDATMIVEDHFDTFATKNYDRLLSRSGLTAQRLHDAVSLIQTLNPKPGNAEGSSPSDRTLHITPDFTVEPDEAHPGRFIVTLNQSIPELSVSEGFTPEAEEALGNGRQAADARTFMRSRRQEASDFIGLVNRRNETLMQIMKAIVKLQQPFFSTEDPETIRPMILKDISAITGRDLSVVSRAAAGKYVATPSAVYPLKMFFNERPHDDSDMSTHRILTAMRQIIDAEDKSRPLSDDALQSALADRGLDIARRTVAKYREMMNIPNSRGRRTLPAHAGKLPADKAGTK